MREPVDRMPTSWSRTLMQQAGGILQSRIGQDAIGALGSRSALGHSNGYHPSLGDPLAARRRRPARATSGRPDRAPRARDHSYAPAAPRQGGRRGRRQAPRPEHRHNGGRARSAHGSEWCRPRPESHGAGPVANAVLRPRPLPPISTGARSGSAPSSLSTLLTPLRVWGRSEGAIARHERQRGHRDGRGDRRRDDERHAEAVEKRLLRRSEQRRARVAARAGGDLRRRRQAFARFGGQAGQAVEFGRGSARS